MLSIPFIADKVKDFFRPRKRGKRGVLALVLAFFIAVIFLTLLLFIFNPMAIDMLSTAGTAAEDILRDTQIQIKDYQLAKEVNESIQKAYNAIPNNIEILSGTIRYAWVIFLLVLALIMYIFSRRLVETGGGRMVV